MRIVIYNSSSFGGCFDYGRELFDAYSRHPEVSSCSWWIPVNADSDKSQGIRKILLNDKPPVENRILRQLHFLFRSIFNPMLLFLRLAATRDSLVILNDFEQLTAFLWVPLFKRVLRQRHKFAILLHDPDRDAYPPNLAWTNYSMNLIMGLTDFAFYHDSLPGKSYYKTGTSCVYLDLPHGIFRMPDPDTECLSAIQKMNPNRLKIMAIPGNIREEKNYDIAIRSLLALPNFALLIAGAPANARVDSDKYRSLASECGVGDRVFWLERYLSAGELSAVVAGADVIVLNYADSFTSQSGILNVAAPFRKVLVVSDGPSSLTAVVRKFSIGTIVTDASPAALATALVQSLENPETKYAAWENYLDFASWDRHVEMAMDCILSNQPELK